jgi:hypothetical protein
MRELAILHIAWLRRAEYEFVQHMILGGGYREGALSHDIPLPNGDRKSTPRTKSNSSTLLHSARAWLSLRGFLQAAYPSLNNEFGFLVSERDAQRILHDEEP